MGRDILVCERVFVWGCVEIERREEGGKVRAREGGTKRGNEMRAVCLGDRVVVRTEVKY